MPRYRQPPVKGGRIPSYAGMIPELRRWIEQEANRYNVYPAFVIAACCGAVSGIDEQPDYHEKPDRHMTPEERRAEAVARQRAQLRAIKGGRKAS